MRSNQNRLAKLEGQIVEANAASESRPSIAQLRAIGTAYAMLAKTHCDDPAHSDRIRALRAAIAEAGIVSRDRGLQHEERSTTGEARSEVGSTSS